MQRFLFALCFLLVPTTLFGQIQPGGSVTSTAVRTQLSGTTGINYNSTTGVISLSNTITTTTATLNSLILNGTMTLTGAVHLPAGTTTVAPLYFQPVTSTNLTTPVAGAVNIVGEAFNWTGSTGTRYQAVPSSTALTSGQLAFATTGGVLTGTNLFTVTSGTTITVNGLVSTLSCNVAGRNLTMNNGSGNPTSVLIYNGSTEVTSILSNGAQRMFLGAYGSVGVDASSNSLGRFYVTGGAADQVTLLARGATTQTADLFDVQNVSGTNQFNVSGTGGVGVHTGWQPNTAAYKSVAVTTGGIPALTTQQVVVTWTTGFADAAYRPRASLIESTTNGGLRVHHVSNITATQIGVVITNDAASTLTGTLHVEGYKVSP